MCVTPKVTAGGGPAPRQPVPLCFIPRRAQPTSAHAEQTELSFTFFHHKCRKCLHFQGKYLCVHRVHSGTNGTHGLRQTRVSPARPGCGRPRLRPACAHLAAPRRARRDLGPRSRLPISGERRAGGHGRARPRLHAGSWASQPQASAGTRRKSPLAPFPRPGHPGAAAAPHRKPGGQGGGTAWGTPGPGCEDEPPSALLTVPWIDGSRTCRARRHSDHSHGGAGRGGIQSPATATKFACATVSKTKQHEGGRAGPARDT